MILGVLETAVGDIHGDLRKAISSLELAQVLQEVNGQVRWAGGDTVVVQLGDVLDRGDSEIGVFRGFGRTATSEMWNIQQIWKQQGNHGLLLDHSCMHCEAYAGVVMLLRELHKQAQAEGGAVYMLNGNHESLNVSGNFRCATCITPLLMAL